jgi:hypothetical protein
LLWLWDFMTAFCMSSIFVFTVPVCIYTKYVRVIELIET